MTTDRDEALRRADLLLRQGDLDAAIAEYTVLVEAFPSDWTLLNALGDLHVRAGAADRAVPLYVRVADAYLGEGFYARAAGFYKKVLKFTPNDEGILLKLAAASAQQGLRADARKFLQTVANARHRRRDLQGLAFVLCSLDDLDRWDLTNRLAALKALIPLQPAEALTRLRHLAGDLETRDKQADADAVWREILSLEPSDEIARVRLARSALAAGDPAGSMAMLERGPVASREALELLIEAHLRVGTHEALARAQAIVLNWLREHPESVDVLTPCSRRVFGEDAPSLFTWIDARAEALAARGQIDEAIESLLAFAQSHAPFTAAVDRALEIASAAGRSDLVTKAQAALVDESSSVAVADDVPEAMIVEPLLEDDEFEGAPLEPLTVMPLLEVEPDPVEAPPALSILEFEADAPTEANDEVDTAPFSPAVPRIVGDDPTAGDAVPQQVVRTIELEVDLTERLDLVAAEAPAHAPASAAAAPPAGPAAAPAAGAPGPGLDEAFESMRRHLPQSGEDLISLGRTYLAAGLQHEAIEAFEVAARDRERRFDAAIALTEVYDARQDSEQVIEWLARAAESAPTPVKRGAVLYRLGVALEATGERERALAVFMELRAIAPGFRDVSARIAMLEAGGTGGGSSTR